MPEEEMIKLFIALKLPYADGSGEVGILGVYDEELKAEARCHRYNKEFGLFEPTKVTSCRLNEDIIDVPEIPGQ